MENNNTSICIKNQINNTESSIFNGCHTNIKSNTKDNIFNNTPTSNRKEKFSTSLMDIEYLYPINEIQFTCLELNHSIKNPINLPSFHMLYETVKEEIPSFDLPTLK
ncbi:hypothetical protein PPL_08263 [Heterostelium album PN500]|uniref:Uncharacterized protein n=1 Tax=Heterostelium pallidum (strain ATCC 26659 / Pp 5 / PN500) TaxID=670386 RepID=D3BHQ0_HETP5|nr:hypothetical protein PPL_08263 [Heterostelium album PN500]EFA78800.1 hypothetical protein PPL_08263 [Heterostelium album PN500]|eukprot:XP_020430924.1 hypothetical protein PPL_08263 [Heterostelium album PN500]